LDTLPEEFSGHNGDVATLRARSLAKRLGLRGQTIDHFAMLLPPGYKVIDALGRVWVLEAKSRGLRFQQWRSFAISAG